MHAAIVLIQRALAAVVDRANRGDDRGQATAEYALILVAAATLGIIVIAWIGGPGAGKIGDLLSSVFDKITSAVS